MKTFYDKENDIEWIHFLKEEAPYIDEYSYYIDKLNNWESNQDIRNYVTENPVGKEMDQLFREFDDTQLFFGKRGDEIVSAVITSSNLPLVGANQLYNFIKDRYNPEDNPNPIDEEYLDKSEANSILDLEYENRLHIEYILINPKFQRQGLATRFYKTLKDNLEFFGGQKDTKLIHLSINENNIGSRKAVLKNGFKRLKPNTKNPIYSSYYLHLPNKNHSEEKSI